MENNAMKVIYQHFGKEKEEDQEIMSITNILYEMGKEKQEMKYEDEKHKRIR